MAPTEAAFRTVRYSQIATRRARDLVLREEPAIYAWYRRLDFANAARSASTFRSNLDLLLSANLSESFSGKLGYLYRVEVRENAGPLTQAGQSLFDELAENENARVALADIIDTAIFFQAPLYVGKALSLRRRVGEHMAGKSGLRERFESAGIPMRTCILRYRYVSDAELEPIVPTAAVVGDDERTAMRDKAIRLIEEILTRLNPTSFVRRPG